MKIITLAVPCAIGLLSTISCADQITLQLDGMGAYESYSLAIDAQLSSSSSADVTYVNGISTGERIWTSQYGREVVTYCIQVYESVAVGEQYTFDIHHDLTEVPESPPHPHAPAARPGPGAGPAPATLRARQSRRPVQI